MDVPDMLKVKRIYGWETLIISLLISYGEGKQAHSPLPKNFRLEI
jgi:hypothetical protein